MKKEVWRYDIQLSYLRITSHNYKPHLLILNYNINSTHSYKINLRQRLQENFRTINGTDNLDIYLLL